jgi:hypothetical protein
MNVPAMVKQLQLCRRVPTVVATLERGAVRFVWALSVYGPTAENQETLQSELPV